ncbi:uncharacterized protein KQ657_005031 [Scheffersomyces spartinae]|uniref:Zn(2)-C6 fungal-type domain-containing protein n=1 Tax=Scheffersomyces spartinae TaxID=45513 RepID=A0A9P7VB35_9ASCO|nr:uncharacterized protein KQ657_005031 [Scheffersomyces spartinae]KAG7194301.1 hypothetical protein KQ657_005031 [Scheffersomyces spartinae]
MYLASIKKKKNSRRKHRNSHLGCGTCKKRRIKCDEGLPLCSNCKRGKLQCAYLKLDESQRSALLIAQRNHSEQLEKQKQMELESSSSTKELSDTSSPPVETSSASSSSLPQPKFKLEDGGTALGNRFPPFPKHSASSHVVPKPPPSVIPSQFGTSSAVGGPPPPSLLPVVPMPLQVSVPSSDNSRRPSFQSPSSFIKKEPGNGSVSILPSKQALFNPAIGTLSTSVSTLMRSSHPPNVPLVFSEGKDNSSSPTSIPQLYPYEPKFYGYIPIGIYQQNGETRVSLPQSVQLSPQHHIPLLPSGSSSSAATTTDTSATTATAAATTAATTATTAATTATTATTAAATTTNTGQVEIPSVSSTNTSTATPTVPSSVINSPRQQIPSTQYLLLPNLALPRYTNGYPSTPTTGHTACGPASLPSMTQQLGSGIYGVPDNFGIPSGTPVNQSLLPRLITSKDPKSAPSPFSLAQPSMIVAYAPTPIYFPQPRSIPTGSTSGTPRPPMTYTSPFVSEDPFENTVLPPLQKKYEHASYPSYQLPPVRSKDEVALVIQTSK